MTVAGNTAITDTAGVGAGVLNQSTGTFTLEKSIIAQNFSGPGTASDLSSDVDTVGANIVQAHDGAALTGPAVIASDPMLASLSDYGGLTQTMALLAGSPALNVAGTTMLTSDQRGFLRNVGGAPDIGAYESGNATGYAIWSAETIPANVDGTFTGDAEGDESPNGNEYALGTNVLLSDPDSPGNPALITNLAGGVEITFGLNPDAKVDTKWVIKRSNDLGIFTEIYSYNGPTDTSTPGVNISAVVVATSITMTDSAPPNPRAFYLFVAESL